MLLLRFWVLREINSRFCIKTQWQTSGLHVGAHVDGHQHGIQISINFWKTFLRISSIRKNVVTWFLARVFAYLPSFFSQILDLIYWKVLIFLFWSIFNCVTLKTSNRFSGLTTAWSTKTSQQATIVGPNEIGREPRKHTVSLSANIQLSTFLFFK